MQTVLTRRLTLALALASLASVATSFALQAPAEPDPLHVVLLHTNDVHGQVQPRAATWLDRDDPPGIGGLPRIAAYVTSVRQEAEADGAGVLLVDGGDWFQGTPEGLIEKGQAYLHAVSKVGYDAMAVGNHEFDHGVEPLARMIAGFELPALSANVYLEEGGERVPWCRPWRVVEVAGVRVGIVGLVTPTTPSITHRDASALHFQDPGEALAAARAELGDGVDWVLPITHLGVQGDRRLAKAHPDLPVVVGGHSHTYLKDGVRQGETLILQSGSKGSAVGRLDLWFDAETRELERTSYRLVDLLDEPAPGTRNEELEEICETLVRESEAAMGEVVGELLEPLERNFRRTHSSPAGNFITDLIRARLEADVAVQNRGGIRCDLPQGPVTRRSLFELQPFGNHLVLLELSGADLLALVRASVEGTAHTGLEVSGMTVLWREDEDSGYALVGLEVAGEPVDAERTYRLATNNFLAGGGDGYDLLEEQRVVREDPLLLRELLEAHFRAERKVALPKDDRYRRTTP